MKMVLFPELGFPTSAMVIDLVTVRLSTGIAMVAGAGAIGVWIQNTLPPGIVARGDERRDQQRVDR